MYSPAQISVIRNNEYINPTTVLSIINAFYDGDSVDLKLAYSVPNEFNPQNSVAFILSSADGLFLNDLTTWSCENFDDYCGPQVPLNMSIVNSTRLVPRVSQAVVEAFPVDQWILIESSPFIKCGECRSLISNFITLFS